jgi:hypothetical protein
MDAAGCPEVQGGYLGADNQLVRVTVLGYDPLKKSGTLLWGWNNASFLYRASLVDPAAAPQILTLNDVAGVLVHTGRGRGAPADQGVHPALATLVGVRADNAVDLTITGCAFPLRRQK